MNKREKPKKEFSKKIFNIVITIFIIVIAYSMALMWKTDDTSALSYLIPSVSALASVCVSFYYWKSKMENMIKLSKENDKSLEEIKEIEMDMSDYDIQINDGDY